MLYVIMNQGLNVAVAHFEWRYLCQVIQLGTEEHPLLRPDRLSSGGSASRQVEE